MTHCLCLFKLHKLHRGSGWADWLGLSRRGLDDERQGSLVPDTASGNSTMPGWIVKSMGVWSTWHSSWKRFMRITMQFAIRSTTVDRSSVLFLYEKLQRGAGAVEGWCEVRDVYLNCTNYIEALVEQTGLDWADVAWMMKGRGVWYLTQHL